MENKLALPNRTTIGNVSGWLFGLIVFTTGILNMFLVHPVPGVVYLLISFLYFPPATAYTRKKLNFSVPLLIKMGLGIILILFTLGVSDLGDMIDKL